MNDQDKSALTKVYEDLRFVDDVREWTCVGCKRVVIQNYVSDCGHLFCHTCQDRFQDSLNVQCYQCQNRIFQMDKENKEVEKNVFNLKVHCLNYKYGCNVVVPLQNLLSHCKVCKDTCRPSIAALYKSKNPLENVARQIASLQQTTRYQNEESKQLTREMFQSVQRTLTENLEKQTTSFEESFCNLSRKMKFLEKQQYEFQIKLEGIPNAIALKFQNEMESCFRTISNKLDFQKIQQNVPHNSEEREQTLIEKINTEMEKKFKTFQSQMLNNLNQQINISRQSLPKNCLNILLLGETGKGKSTLIDSFANYAHYQTFADARQGPEICPIPTKFTFTDEEFAESTIKSHYTDSNECDVIGQLGTLSCKSYVFAVNDYVDVRWIDSSGFCSSNGPNFDNEIVKDIVNYLEPLEVIHAVAIVMNSNEARMTDRFQYSLQQIFSIFHKSAAPNFIFVFTHGNKPKDALPTVKSSIESILKSAPEAEFINNLINRNNVFCFENEIFQNILAIKSQDDFHIENEANMEFSWTSNSEEFGKLIRHVESVKCHDFQSTVKINEMRSFLNNVNAMIDFLDKRKRSSPSPLKPVNDHSGNQYKLESERKQLIATTAKIFNYIKSNALLYKNFKLTDFVKTLSPSGELPPEIERHVPKTPTKHSFFYNEIYEIKKQLILLDICGSKFDSIFKIDFNRQKQKLNKNREMIVSTENAVFNILM